MLTEIHSKSPSPEVIPTAIEPSPASTWNPLPYLYRGLKYYSVKSLIPFWKYCAGFDAQELQTLLYKDHEALDWKMGSTAPTILITSLSSKIVKALHLRIKDSYSPSEDELSNLTLAINATLTKILLNIQKNIPSHENQPVAILKIFASLAQKHFPALADQLPKIQAIEDEKERQRQLKDLFAPLAVDFFKVTFPNGKNDLPLPYPVQDIAWDFLKKLFHQDKDKPDGKLAYVKSVACKPLAPALPAGFVFEIYQILTTPLLSDGHAELAAMEGGEFWMQLSQFIANKTADNVPSLLAVKRELIAKEIVDILDVEPRNKSTIESWLSSLIMDLGKPDPQLTPVWKFLSRYLMSTINHRLLALNKSQFEEAKRMLEYIKGTILPGIAEIENDPSAESRHAKLIQRFEPVSDKLVALGGLENPANLRFPFFKKELVMLITLARRKFLPEFLADFYEDVTHPQRSFPELDRRLKVLFFDENFALANLSADERAQTLRALYHNLGDPQNELWRRSGIAELAREIETSFSFVSRGLREIIRNYLRADSENAAQLMIDFLPKKELSQPGKLWLSFLIKQAVEHHDPIVEQLFQGIEKIIEQALLHVFVFVGERTEKVIQPGVNEHGQKYLIANIVIRLLDVVHRRPNITIQINACQQLNPVERQEALRKIFEPLAQEFLQIGIENPLDNLPMLRYLKTDLWEAIQTKIVPDLLEKMYRRLNFWQARAETSKQTIRAIFETSHPEEASNVIAHFGSEYIPYYLTFAHEEVALKLRHQAEEWFRADPEISRYLQSHQDTIVKLLGSNIHQYGESLHPAIIANKPYTTKMIDGLILKLMANLASKVHTTEQQKPNFMVESFKSLLEVTTHHFLSINRVTHNNRLKHAWNVSYEEMVAGFGNDLHRGIPDPRLSREEQNRHRMDNFYKPVTQRLFRLMNVENDPEFQQFLDTEPMRQLWGIVQQQLFPNLLQSVFEKLMEPHTIRTMLLNSLDTLNLALNSIPAQDPEPADEVPDQPELNEACGQLVLQLLGLVPRTFAHSVFEIDRVQKIAAQTIGSAISRTLRQWTWIKIMDKGLYNGIPSFRMGKWDGAEKVAKFVPQKVLVGPDGREVIEPDQLTFHLPKTEQGKALLEAKKQLDERTTEARLKHLMAVMTSRQIKSTIASIVRRYWDMIQQFIDEKIQLYFGLVGLKAKEGLDIIFGTIMFEVVAPLVEFVVAPFSILFWYLLEEFLAARADDLSKDAIHRIQENLFFALMDKFLDNFEPVHG